MYAVWGVHGAFVVDLFGMWEDEGSLLINAVRGKERWGSQDYVWASLQQVWHFVFVRSEDCVLSS
jgi:hypothetical protein